MAFSKTDYMHAHKVVECLCDDCGVNSGTGFHLRERGETTYETCLFIDKEHAAESLRNIIRACCKRLWQIAPEKIVDAVVEREHQEASHGG